MSLLRFQGLGFGMSVSTAWVSGFRVYVSENGHNNSKYINSNSHNSTNTTVDMDNPA